MTKGLILHITGTNGAGKTTVAKAFMSAAIRTTPKFISGRNAPIGFDLGIDGVSRNVYLVGNYADGLGSSGCDNIQDIPFMYDHLVEKWEAGNHVVFEGIRTMNHTKGLALYSKTKAITVFRLMTTIEESLAGIRARRLAAGNDKPLENESHIRSNVVRASNYGYKLQALGCPVIKVTREDGATKMLELLRAVE